MSNNLLTGLGGTTILFLILVPLIINIVILVWLHNISLNTYRTYMLLDDIDMHLEKLFDKYEAMDDDLQILPLKGVFIGGNTQLFSRIKKHLPNFAFISEDAVSFDESFVIDSDVVVICPERMNNKLKVFTFSVLGKNKIEGEVTVHSDDSLDDIMKKISGAVSSET
jgi:hypothetical protein